MKNFCFVSPRLVIQKGDFLGSGVPYWPLELAIFASLVRQIDRVTIVDLFGEGISKLEDKNDHYLQGNSIQDLANSERLKDAEVFILFAISYMSHNELLEISAWLRATYPNKIIVVLENAQAVTSYSAWDVRTQFFSKGVDYVLCGQPYSNWSFVRRTIVNKLEPDHLVANLATPRTRSIRRSRHESLNYPVPAWDLIELENYWSIPYAHGPKQKKYLPMLTSRGCPYACDFCTIPTLSGRRWEGNSPKNVVDEMEYCLQKFGVAHFHIEDVNPTVQRKRWEKICELLIERDLDIRFYFVSGTKAETIKIDKVQLFKDAGCRYISISPESGDVALMKTIGKKFDQKHGIELVKECSRVGIKTQACFLIGHPKSNESEFLETKKYALSLVKAGLDEIAVFIVSSFAGSKLHQENLIENMGDKIITFSPKGRPNYDELCKQRNELIKSYIFYQLLHPMKFASMALRALIKNPKTKIENLPLRIFHVNKLIIKSKMRLSKQ